MSGPINYNIAKGEDVRRVVAKIEDTLSVMCDACRGSGEVEDNTCSVCDGAGKTSSEDELVVLMACLSLALMIQHSEISSMELMTGVLGASEWISLYLSSIEDGDMENELPKNKVN